jgi:hypothetical protein
MVKHKPKIEDSRIAIKTGTWREKNDENTDTSQTSNQLTPAIVMTNLQS